MTVAQYREENNSLPTLSMLTNSWTGFTGLGNRQFEVASGIAYLSVNNFFNSAGSMEALGVLRSISSGATFESALDAHGGFSLEGLNGGYQSLIPVP